MKSFQQNQKKQTSNNSFSTQGIQNFGSNQERITALNNNQIKHTVEAGDSYWGISKKYGVSLETVQAANNWKEIIHPGEVIVFFLDNDRSVQEQEPQASDDKKYNSKIGSELAAASLAETAGRTSSTGMCYFHVANAVDKVIGRFLYGGHAYMAAEQLAAKKDLFLEINGANLSSLPAGAIVVWGKGSSKSGHISISQGDGNETSDFIGKQMLSHYGGGSARVFVPK